jgi:hypothetical protein
MADPDTRDPLVFDSVTHATLAHRGRAAFCASHGGRYAGYYAAKMGLGAVVLNDAGIGRDQAGLAGIVLLERLRVPAATVAHTSARIGSGEHGLRHGQLSAVNGPAASLGLAIGMSAHEAMMRLVAAHLVPAPAPPDEAETRVCIDAACRPGISVHAVDSVTLVRPEDAGQIIVTGSHGGLLNGVAASAIKQPVFAAIFNDAGVGVDAAGTTRLPALDARSISGACVSTFSCHIGSGLSAYRDGVISAVNATAAAHGALIGMSAAAFVARMVEAKAKAKANAT